MEDLHAWMALGRLVLGFGSFVYAGMALLEYLRCGTTVRAACLLAFAAWLQPY